MRKQRTHVFKHEVSVGIGLETFAKEVPNMANNDDEDIADVGGEEDVVGRLLLDDTFDRFSKRMTRSEPEGFISAVTKFRVDGGENLFGSGWNAGIGEAIFGLVSLVKDSVF